MKSKVKELLEWWNAIEDKQAYDFDLFFTKPFMESLSDDIDDIIDMLSDLDADDLATVSGCFEDIYGKFMTDETYKRLEILEEKIK
jgi:hypothetical protein